MHGYLAVPFNIGDVKYRNIPRTYTKDLPYAQMQFELYDAICIRIPMKQPIKNNKDSFHHHILYLSPWSLCGVFIEKKNLEANKYFATVP